MNKIKFNTDRIIGLSAMLISLTTLIIFIYQTRLMRDQSRLSVRPRLSFSQNQMYNLTDSIYEISLEIVNKGLGPAIIESIQIIHEKAQHKADFIEFTETEYPKVQKFGSFSQSVTLSQGTTLSPGESIMMYTYRTELSLVDSFRNEFGIEKYDRPFNIEIVYGSIYEELWKVNNEKDGHPEKVR